MRKEWFTPLLKLGCIICLLVVQILVPADSVSAAPPEQQNTFDPTNAQRAAVLVMQVYTNATGQTVISCIGSGTIVSPDGLILTNAHLAIPSQTCQSDRLVIGLNVRIGEAPVVTYYAKVVESNVGWDLAVLQITSTLDQRPVDRAALSLPSVEVDTSDSTKLDSTISVVGFTFGDQRSSGISQVLPGTVSGFTAEARAGDPAWIKTTAAIPGSMSGGAAYNIDGQLIGIPTIQPARSGGATLNCRHIQDTNGDGRVTDDDNCIPISGFINALRPARLARGLILAARLGIRPAIQPFSQPDTQPSGAPTFSRLFFAPGVNQAGMPISVVTGMPSGTSRLYAFFDYDNMVDGMIYELRTSLNGVPNPTFSLAPATWSGGRRGMWYIGSTAQVWPNGTYEFALFIEGVRTVSRQITIGGAARQDPAFSDILFGLLDSNDQLVDTGDVLAVGDIINAEFVYNNMAAGQTWRQVWYYQGLKIAENSDTWKEAGNGKKSTSARSTADQPLQPGSYRLELYLGDQMAATADFVMAGGNVAYKTSVFSNVSFASDVKNNAPSGVLGTTFGNTLQHLYATFDWKDLAPGTAWTWRWSVDDNLLFEVTQPWGAPLNGSAAWLRLDSDTFLPDGSFKVELIIAGVVMGSATAKVGQGLLPVGTFGTAAGVQMQGTIIDADTRQGIAGVSVIVLKTDFAVRDFTWDMTQVFVMATTDSAGGFSLSKPLLRGDPPNFQTYSLIILARGYLPVTTDSLTIDDKTKSPVILNIEMNRD